MGLSKNANSFSTLHTTRLHCRFWGSLRAQSLPTMRMSVYFLRGVTLSGQIDQLAYNFPHVLEDTCVCIANHGIYLCS